MAAANHTRANRCDLVWLQGIAQQHTFGDVTVFQSHCFMCYVQLTALYVTFTNTFFCSLKICSLVSLDVSVIQVLVDR